MDYEEILDKVASFIIPPLGRILLGALAVIAGVWVFWAAFSLIYLVTNYFVFGGPLVEYEVRTNGMFWVSFGPFYVLIAWVLAVALYKLGNYVWNRIKTYWEARHEAHTD